MPLYSYECKVCGPFGDWRPLSQSNAKVPCPQCRKPSRRQIALPFVECITSSVRSAHQRNERSADRPRVMGHDELHRLGHRRGHGHGHTHGRSMYSSVLGHAH